MATTNVSTFLRRLTRGMAAEALRDQPDRHLVEQLLAGRDEAAFEAVVRRHGPMVYRVCWRVLQQEQDTEDAFQATFLILAQRVHTVRRHASLASWLHGIAHRVAIKARARAATHRRHEQKALPRHVPPDEITWRKVRDVLDAELQQLPEKWRLPLILCYLEGRTQDETAGQLGWSKRTLRRRLEEARAALGRRLTRRGVVWPAALAAVLLSDCVAPAALAPGLVGSTVEAAAGLAGGQAATAAVSANAAALTQGVLETMVVTKFNTAVAGLVILSLIALGAGLVTLNTSTAAQEGQARKPPALGAEGPEGPASKPAVDRPETALIRALEAAERMNNKELKARALADLAAAQATSGDGAGAKKTFWKAFDLVETFDLVPDRCFALNALGGAQWRAGEHDAARETFQKSADAAKGHDDPDQIQHLLLGTAFAQEACGDFEGARKTWEDNDLAKEVGASGPYLKARIAAGRARAGDLKRAQETFAQLDAGAAVPFKQEAVTELSGALLRRGDRKAAEELLARALAEAAGLPDEYGAKEEGIAFPRSSALAQLAIAQDRMGDRSGAARSLEQALNLLSEHKPTTDVAAANKAGGLAQVAAAQADLGDREAALKTVQLALEAAKEMGEPDPTRVDRTAILESIVHAQIKARDWPGAVKTLRPLSWEKADVVEDLALAMTRAGETDRAVDLTAETDFPVVRARAFLGIARGLAERKSQGKP
jgi:RNA polymerase sigma factor (sigma-70 family)